MTSLLTTVGLLVAAAVATAQGESERPVLLKRIDGEGLSLEVIASSARAIYATYSLEVVSGDERGGNRSLQGGDVRLEPGQAVILLRHNVSNATLERWVATLIVQPKGAAGYKVVLRSD